MIGNRTWRRRRGQGFTLSEALIAAMVLAAAVAAISESIVSGQAQQYEARHAWRAATAAEELMERIVALPYADPDGDSDAGPEGGEVGPLGFDNADDYDGYEEALGELTDGDGEAYPAEYARYGRTATAEYGTMSVAGFAEPIAGLSVTVTVTDDKGRSWTLTRFIAEP